MAPQIGQRARLNGKDVVWSGDNYGWQSPASYALLERQGKFKFGAQQIDRLLSSAGQNPIVQRLGQFQQDFDKATAWADPVVDLALRAERQSQNIPSGIIGQSIGQATQGAANLLNVDPRLALVGMVAGGKGSGAIRRRMGFGQTSLNAPRQTTTGGGFTGARNAQGQALPGQSRIQNVDPQTGRVRQWVPAPPTGQPNIRQPNGTRARLDETRGSWQLEDFQAKRGADGSIQLESVNPVVPQPRRADQFIQDRLAGANSKNGPVTQYGSSSFKPATNQAPQNPAPGPGQPRPQRVHVEGQPGPKRLERGFEVKTSDMSKPRGDGNSYGPFERVSELPDGWQTTGNFITRNDQAYRINRDKMRATFLEGKASAKDYSAVREAVAWADNDVDVLNKILGGLGGSPQRNASTAKRVIERKLGALENRYGGKPSLSKGERQQLTDQWDWDNLKGADQREAQRLSELANQRFGQGSRGRRPITQQPSGGFKGGQVPPEIQQRLDNAPRSRGGRLPRRTTQPPTPQSTRTERADALQQLRDESLLKQGTKPAYEPKLSDAEREAARAARRNRPLRPAALRTGQKKGSQPQGLGGLIPDWLKRRLGQ